MAKARQRPIAVFHFRKSLGVATFMGNVGAILLQISQHPAIFVTPSPALSVVSGHLDELKAAQAKAQTRVTSAASGRNVKYNVVRTDVIGLLSYVQGLADAAPKVLEAVGIIASSGFKIKGRSARVKPLLDARRGLTGEIYLIARGAGKRDFHEWAMSTNGTHWTQLPSTVKAKTKVTGLKPLTTMYFRHRVITKDGPLNWSDSVQIVVL